MILRNILLPGVVTPAVTTAVVLLLSLPTRRGASRCGLAGAAVAAGFLAAFAAVSGWPRWPPIEATQRLFFVVGGAGLVSWLVGRRHHRSMGLAVEIVAVALLIPLILWALVEHTWSPLESVLWLSGLFLTALGLSRAWGASLEDHSFDLLSSGVRLMLISGIATALGLSESFRLAQLAGALACGVVVVELFVQQRLVAWGRSDAVVVSTILAGLLLVGHFYAALESLPAVLLLTALLLLWLPATKRRWVRLLPLLPLLVALGLVTAAFLQQEDDPYGDYSRLPRTAQPVSRVA